MNAVVEYEASRGDEPEYRPAEKQALVQLGTLQASTPVALIEGATAISDKLADIIRKNKLSTRIQGKEYVRVEGWTTLAALLGVIAREDGVEAMEDGSYLATVSLVRMADGQVISTASAECGMDEDRWSKMPRYARRSMAVTRATGKAARLAFSWIMALAGFQATPAEEMDFAGSHGNSDEPESLPDVVPFGKNKGKTWSSLTDKSLSWYCEECNNDAARAAAVAERNRRSGVIEGESREPGQDDDY